MADRKPWQYKPTGEKALCRKTVAVKLPEEWVILLDRLPNKSDRLRQWIEEGMKREGLIS